MNGRVQYNHTVPQPTNWRKNWQNWQNRESKLPWNYTAACSAFKCSIPHPPLDGSRTNLYFLGCKHPSKSHVGLSLGSAVTCGVLVSEAPRVSMKDWGTEKERNDDSGLLLETQRNEVGIIGVGSTAGTSSASCSASSSSAGAAFLPRRDCFLSRRFIVSVYTMFMMLVPEQN